MNKMEKEALTNVILALSDEEKEHAIRLIPSDYLIKELVRRTVITDKLVQNIRSIVNDSPEQMTLTEAQDFIFELKNLLS